MLDRVERSEKRLREGNENAVDKEELQMGNQANISSDRSDLIVRIEG